MRFLLPRALPAAVWFSKLDKGLGKDALASVWAAWVGVALLGVRKTCASWEGSAPPKSSDSASANISSRESGPSMLPPAA